MQAESILQHHSSVYQVVTEQILKQLESGVVPWRKPWRTEPPCNLLSGKTYRGINTFLLASQGYGSRYWLTFNQASKLGGSVRKGEKSSIVTFWNIGEEKLVRKTDGSTRKEKPFLLKYYRVFNVEQTDGIADKLGLGNAEPRNFSIDACEAIYNSMPHAPSMEQDSRAWYRPSTDSIGMPSKTLFNSPEEYYSTLYHELTHSTGHSLRVGREGIEQLNTFGSESYSREELIAEMGAALLCGITGISPATIPNSAAYIQCWINRLRGDSRLLVSAASQAQKAADYIQGGAL
ncbi:MAG TPA: zincin-like metallopeptidase domain-containing protein [Candidatus Saccharimonadales bacterium]|jgi:antirestriction protein ArdC|nr:zincin-like metallopeptidase domain-containing protein [Candidatus Saccharimonadales bacterium]